MSALSDGQFQDRMANGARIVEPFFDGVVSFEGDQRVASFGLGPYGYDVRLGSEFRRLDWPAYVRSRLLNYLSERGPFSIRQHPDAKDQTWVDKPGILNTMNPSHMMAGAYSNPNLMDAIALDPLNVEEEHFVSTMVNVDENGRGRFTLRPGEFVLAHTMEWVQMPKDCVALVCDKSTYARAGIALQNTVLEPGWFGQVTLEITNHLSVPVSLRVGEGIAQVIFFKGEKVPLVTYGDRNGGKGGKYMGQSGVTIGR